MSEQQIPDRAYSMTLKIGADTRELFKLALVELLVEFEQGRLNGKFLTAGVSHGYHGEMRVNGDMTHDAYMATLEKLTEQPQETANAV